MRPTLVFAAVLTLLVPPAIAGQALDMKPGRWQITSAFNTAGSKPPPNLPPDMAAKVMKAWAAQSKPKIMFACLTAQDMQHGLEGNDSECKGKLSYAGGRISGMQTCDEGRKVSISGSYTSTSYDMKIKPNGGEGPTVHMIGRWLGAQCKPGE